MKAMFLTCLLMMTAYTAVVAGCSGCTSTSASPSYIAADRQTHDSGQRFVSKYKTAYPDEAAEVQDWYDAWGRRITAAEGGTAAPATSR